jgi:hypothetical protein
MGGFDWGCDKPVGPTALKMTVKGEGWKEVVQEAEKWWKQW